MASTSKMPFRDDGMRLYTSNEFYDWKNVSFVGCPFPLEEADIHLGRLSNYGFTLIRFIITWEAVEHSGPGEYDQEYLEYLVQVVRKCHKYGMAVVIDSHQDVWSRWTGGDGAPAWTLIKAGFALKNLDASGAAVTRENFGKDLPCMVWNSNNFRLAAGTMWTLFFAGNDFAPNTFIDGETAQNYLQRHYCNAMAQVARAVRDEPNVLGFDFLNEPNVGFVGMKDARSISDNQFYVGWRVSPFTAMELGAGETRTVDYFEKFLIYGGQRVLNEDHVCAWENGPESCIWRQNGVWEMDRGSNKPKLLKPNYFASNPKTGREIDFLNDYAIPFWMSVKDAIRKEMPQAVMFAEPVFDMTKPGASDTPVLTDNQIGKPGFVWAKHWYDGTTLMSKRFSKIVGMDTFSKKIGFGTKQMIKVHGEGIAAFFGEASRMGSAGSPVLIGECGIPFDLNDGDAYQTGDFSRENCALNVTLASLEYAMASFTLWNYNPQNTNSDGDRWNGEDLSIFSKDQVEEGEEDDLYAGGRCLAVAIRPTASRTAGVPLTTSFEPYRADKRFILKYQNDPQVQTTETVIFLPKYQYPHGAKINVSDGKYNIDWDTQTLTYNHDPHVEYHDIIVTKLESTQIEVRVDDRDKQKRITPLELIHA
eukprot:CAMPEP_0203763368 /NCGR_PEP_ID=MMETSP0098-20131031/16084_1 /ASSEMBLY_ACC=CAM_ASM_000208 /TAXON_ID=96639 /ORGANISM=" , Strain NY0313808BC1" /LENGTH=645 /DNA_ID=CAMNT_0050658117 /DNA_START=1120 /DNA_END=3057 /DNA_ORIENTATION=-